MRQKRGGGDHSRRYVIQKKTRFEKKEDTASNWKQQCLHYSRKKIHVKGGKGPITAFEGRPRTGEQIIIVGRGIP